MEIPYTSSTSQKSKKHFLIFSYDASWRLVINFKYNVVYLFFDFACLGFFQQFYTCIFFLQAISSFVRPSVTDCKSEPNYHVKVAVTAIKQHHLTNLMPHIRPCYEPWTCFFGTPDIIAVFPCQPILEFFVQLFLFIIFYWTSFYLQDWYR